MAFPPLSPELLQLHWEELEFLWAQRLSMLRSPRQKLYDLAALDERIAAHIQGVLVSVDDALPVLEPALLAGGPSISLASSVALLYTRREDLARKVGQAFLKANGPALDGLREGMSHAPIDTLRATLREALGGSSLPHALVAAEVLADHGQPEATQFSPHDALRHENPMFRRAGWRLVGKTKRWPSDLGERGIQDADASVRREALAAAAWCGFQGIMDYLQRLAMKPELRHADALWLYALLARPEDARQIVVIGRGGELGMQRFRILGALGHPDGIEPLLGGMAEADPRMAVSSAQAFARITGADVNSSQRVPLPPEDGYEPDAFEQEFLDEAFLPDPAKARAFWERAKPQFQKGTRWCRGIDLTQPGGPERWDLLDLEARREAYLRGAFHGQWQGGPADLTRFPAGG